MLLPFILPNMCFTFRKYIMRWYLTNHCMRWTILFCHLRIPGISTCVTFQTDGEQDQTIISNYHPDIVDLPFRGTFASSKEIQIWGAKTKLSSVPIEYENRKMNRLHFLLNGRIIMVHFTSMVKRRLLTYRRIRVR